MAATFRVTDSSGALINYTARANFAGTLVSLTSIAVDTNSLPPPPPSSTGTQMGINFTTQGWPAGTTAASERVTLLTPFPGGMGPRVKFFDGGGGWSKAYNSLVNSKYGSKASERNPCICAKVHTDAAFNTLMTNMAALFPGQFWYAIYFQEPEDDMQKGDLDATAWTNQILELDTLRKAHPNGNLCKLAVALNGYSEYDNVQAPYTYQQLLPPLAGVLDLVGIDIYQSTAGEHIDPNPLTFPINETFGVGTAAGALIGKPWAALEFGMALCPALGDTDAALANRITGALNYMYADPTCLGAGWWMDQQEWGLYGWQNTPLSLAVWQNAMLAS